MNAKEVVKKACREPTFQKALAWISVWECDRIIRQFKEGKSGIPRKWESCFEFLIGQVFANYRPCVRSKMATVWLVTFTNCIWPKELHVFHKDATIEEVQQFVKVHEPEGRRFQVKRVDVGKFDVRYIYQMYIGDSRGLDEKGKVVI